MTLLDSFMNGIKNALSDPLISRLFFLSLEITVMAVLALFIIRVTRIKSMRFVALVWLLVLAKPIFGLIVGSPFRLIDFPEPAPSVMIIDSNENFNLDELIAARMEKDRMRLSERSTQIAAPVSAETTSIEVQSPMEENIHSGSRSISLARVLRTFWFSGIAFFVFLTLIDRSRIRRLKKSSLPPSQEMEKLYSDLAQEMNIERFPKLRLCPVLESPALVGIFKPVVLLPQWMTEKSDYAQLKWLLRHELTHWMRKDSFALLLRRISETLFFFHPVIWLAGRKWEEAMELACDRAILNSEPEAINYAEHLFRILENQRARVRRPVSAGLFATRTQIGKRIAALLSNPLSAPARLGVFSMSALFILAIIGFSLGLGFQRESRAQDADKSKSQSLSHEEEEKIREKASRVHADLRSLAVAMESYYVDYNVYPQNLHVLTTPIAYITKIPTDAFTVSETERAADESRSLKIGYAPDYKAIYLYSVGPDGIDQEGNISYNPANGTSSHGDIVRIIDSGLHPILHIKDKELQDKVNAQKNELSKVKSALESWFLVNRNFPENLDQLISPKEFINKIPKDIFSPGKPVSYIYDKEGGIVIVYSVGPDKVDDNGVVEIAGFHEKGEIPKGDIALKMELAQLEKQYPKDISPELLEDDVMMQDLLKMKEKDGKDNALYHYQMASKIMPPVPNQTQNDLIRKILNQGWDDSAEELIPYMNTYEPMFKEIRKGAALDYAKNVGWDRGPATPVPNFLSAQISAKMLCVEGRYLESQRKYREALNNYLTALTMGRDYGAPDGLLISALISIAIENISLRQIHQLVRSGNLNDSELSGLLERLKAIEDTTVTAPEAMIGESHFTKWVFKNLRENPEKIDDNVSEIEKELGIEKAEFAKYADLMEAEHDKLWDLQLSYIKTPYWERDRAAFQKKLDDMLKTAFPINKVSFPNFHEADVRIFSALSYLRQTRIATALEPFKSQNGHFPGATSELVPQYFDKLPIDPFSGKDFIYNLSQKGDGYDLYSLGPDMMDNDGKIRYDPTNGTISAGDMKLQ